MAGEVVGAIERALAIATPVLPSWGFRNRGGGHEEWKDGGEEKESRPDRG